MGPAVHPGVGDACSAATGFVGFDPNAGIELFYGKHGGIDWRYPEAIGWLAP